MSIKIVTVEEAEKSKKTAEKYGECFEEVRGKANQDYMCDNSDKAIPKDSECSVIMILPSKKHFNYKHQKAMLTDYVH